MARNVSMALFVATLLAAWVSCCGCSAVPLPAIDPSGERIFLPSPSYTTVVSPYDSVAQLPCLPQPAFTEPPPIPPCNQIPGAPGIAGTGVIPQPVPDRLILSPAKIVAPINSEVVLLAGLCGREGYYITKQPIEWMLSSDSVGNIIDLADSTHPHVAKLAHHEPRKECNNLALTRTSAAAHVVTRGTPLPNDDVWVGKGQTWISVSSPTEGASYVTALAKRADNWETRRQTATIYWVDMQWAFPPPKIVPAGEPAVLSTTVTKTSTGNPAANAIVRYDVTGGSPASFFGDGRRSFEVQTDENGRADAQLIQDAPGPGTTQVRIQIFSNMTPSDGSARAVIGQGFTTVTWSAPGLAIAISGPSLVSRNSAASYRLEVSNPGDSATRGVMVRIDLPTSFKYLNSRPAAELFGSRLEWRLGDLAPQQVQSIELNLQAINSGEYQVLARATSQNTRETSAVALTRIVESALTVRFVDPPAAAAVGSRVEFNFEVTNTGGIPLNNVLVRDVFDPGLQPAYPDVDPTRPLELSLGTIAAGETIRRGVALMVQRAGQLCHTLQVSADGGHTAAARACITATQPVLKVEVRKIGPNQARVGESVRFIINVTNTGEGVLTNLQIADVPDQHFQPDQGTLGLEKIGNTIVWKVGNLGPTQNLTREIVCICRTEAAAAQNQVEVTADGGVRETAVAQLAILATAAPAPISPPRETQPTSAGKLQLEVVDLGDPFVGGTASAIIVIRNLSSEPDQDVQLTVTLPPELLTKSPVIQQSLKAPVTPIAGGIAIGPIREIRGNETLPSISLTATAAKAGKYKIKVRAESRRSQPIEAEAEINVVAR